MKQKLDLVSRLFELHSRLQRNMMIRFYAYFFLDHLSQSVSDKARRIRIGTFGPFFNNLVRTYWHSHLWSGQIYMYSVCQAQFYYERVIGYQTNYWPTVTIKDSYNRAFYLIKEATSEIVIVCGAFGKMITDEKIQALCTSMEMQSKTALSLLTRIQVNRKSLIDKNFEAYLKINYSIKEYRVPPLFGNAIDHDFASVCVGLSSMLLILVAVCESCKLLDFLK